METRLFPFFVFGISGDFRPPPLPSELPRRPPSSCTPFPFQLFLTGYVSCVRAWLLVSFPHRPAFSRGFFPPPGRTNSLFGMFVHGSSSDLNAYSLFSFLIDGSQHLRQSPTVGLCGVHQLVGSAAPLRGLFCFLRMGDRKAMRLTEISQIILPGTPSFFPGDARSRFGAPY